MSTTTLELIKVECCGATLPEAQTGSPVCADGDLIMCAEHLNEHACSCPVCAND